MSTFLAIQDKAFGFIEGWRDAIPKSRGPVVDYKRLMGADAWERLPAAVHQRFDHTVVREVSYVGRFKRVEASFAGRCLAKLCRYLGEPLVGQVGKDVAAHVRVFPRPSRWHGVGTKLSLQEPSHAHRAFGKTTGPRRHTCRMPWAWFSHASDPRGRRR